MKDLPAADHMAETARLTLPAPPSHSAAAKRVLDVALCLLVAPIAMPLIALGWLVVRLDGGPGFFAQRRVGRGGRQFWCLKLRSMHVDADARLEALCTRNPQIAKEWHIYQKLARDPRITRVGRLLRATSLDELPQLFNVLRGDMSLVGPRPILPGQEALYRMAGGRAYFTLRPGITGPWQIDGRGRTAFVERVRYDEGYARHQSLREDLRLLALTARVVALRTGR